MLNKTELTALTNQLNGLQAKIVADPLTAVQASAQLREVLDLFDKNLKAVAVNAYKAGVEARKVEREVKKNARLAAFAEATKAKEEAKAKLAAAKALIEKKPRAKKAKGKAEEPKFTPKVELIKKGKKAKKDNRSADTKLVDSQAGALMDIAGDLQ